jgi:porin
MATAGLASAAEPDPPAFAGPLLERPYLTGDWFGRRSMLWERGITLDVSATQFGQGVTSGGLDRGFPFGGRADYFLTVDTGKLGLLEGGSVVLHGETRYGESANLLTGALLPVSLMLSVPLQEGSVTALTGVRYIHQLTDRTLFYVGKVNTLDDFRQPFTIADGTRGFLHTALIFNPVLSRTVPYSTYGAGLAVMGDGHVPWFADDVLDTNDTPTTSGFDTFFDNGATVFAQVNVPTRFLGRPGHLGVSGAVSSGRYQDLKPSVYYDPVEGLPLRSSPASGSWCIAYAFDQALGSAADDPDRVWGVFGRLGLADGRTSPVCWYTDVGLAGASPLPGRGLDEFGVGYFYVGISEKLKRLAAGFVPLRDEQGVEVYYSVAVTPWCRVTPDVQVVVPFQRRADPALVVGVRARVDF